MQVLRALENVKPRSTNPKRKQHDAGDADPKHLHSTMSFSQVQLHPPKGLKTRVNYPGDILSTRPIHLWGTRGRCMFVIEDIPEPNIVRK